MENLRKRINVRLVNNAEDYKKYVSKPIFVSQKKFSNDFAVIHEIKTVLTLNKPIYVGFSILDLSKLLCMNLITNTLKVNLMLIYYSQTQTVLFMKVKQMFMKIFIKTKICLILVIIH